MHLDSDGEERRKALLPPRPAPPPSDMLQELDDLERVLPLLMGDRAHGVLPLVVGGDSNAGALLVVLQREHPCIIAGRLPPVLLCPALPLHLRHKTVRLSSAHLHRDRRFEAPSHGRFGF